MKRPETEDETPKQHPIQINENIFAAKEMQLHRLNRAYRLGDSTKRVTGGALMAATYEYFNNDDWVLVVEGGWYRFRRVLSRTSKELVLQQPVNPFVIPDEVQAEYEKITSVTPKWNIAWRGRFWRASAIIDKFPDTPYTRIAEAAIVATLEYDLRWDYSKKEWISE